MISLTRRFHENGIAKNVVFFADNEDDAIAILIDNEEHYKEFTVEDCEFI